MTTSEDQRSKMRKIPDHSRVRRRLFDEPQDQASIDNIANILQECYKTDRDNAIKKWNFDLVRDVGLEGPYKWYYKGENSWVGMKTQSKSDTVLDDNNLVSIEKENQLTPRVLTVDIPPVIRKRKRDSCVLNEKDAKRKISFE